MERKRTVSRHARVLLLVGMLAASTALMTPAQADVENDNLPGGTSISVAIDSPADGALIGSPPGNVDLTGTASVGQGLPVADTTLIYVVDVSGSTDNLVGCGGDQNGNGDADLVLDCEIAAVKALNGQAVSSGTVDEVGLAVFADTGAAADVGPGAGEQPLTGPATDANGAGGPDVEEVASSTFSQFGGNGGVDLFTPKVVGVSTDFEAAVQQACGLVQSSTNPNNIVIFLSDGTSTGSGSALDDLPCAPSSATFQTFAVGAASSCTDPGTQGSLAQIAAATGGECTLVTNVAELPDVVPGVIDSMLTRLLLTVDGGAPADISASSTPALPVSGPASVAFSTSVPGLAPGQHELCVTAVGTDAGGAGSVTDCHTVLVASISLAPPAATNELGAPAQTHEVTATVAAGAGGGVEGTPVSFSVTGGPNAGEAGSDTTDANGEAVFTYAATQGPGGLGQDTIQACFTDDQGHTNCATASKDWVDTSPPVVKCAATANPSGQNTPRAGNNPRSGQNPDGFYVLTASDAVDPDPTVLLADSGSSATFGPFPSGTTIKLTQAPGAIPDQRPGPGTIDWHITINGDGLLTATDASGNTSAPVACLVPQPPK